MKLLLPYNPMLTKTEKMEKVQKLKTKRKKKWHKCEIA